MEKTKCPTCGSECTIQDCGFCINLQGTHRNPDCCGEWNYIPLPQSTKEQDEKYGLLKIHSEHTEILLKACEKALEEREAELSRLRKENEELKKIEMDRENYTFSFIEFLWFGKNNSWDSKITLLTDSMPNFKRFISRFNEFHKEFKSLLNKQK